MPRVTKYNIAELQTLLLNWFAENGRDFPWRKAGMTNYQLVIAEVLLQRTKAETIAGFNSKFIMDFPNWQSIATADIGKIENYLRPIGLYKQRAARLKNLALEMTRRKDTFPQDREELESIPFLGQYIANAVELMIFQKPSPLIDVNMARVLERYFGERKMADIRYDPYLQNLAKKLVNNPQSKELNWAILDFAAMVCKAGKPACITCMLNQACTYYNKSLK